MKQMLLLALACTGCVPLAAREPLFAQAMPLCGLVSNQQRYEGQHVLVSGLYASTPHGGMLYSPKCLSSIQLRGPRKDADYKRAAQIIEAAFIKNKFARVPVVVSGIFRQAERWETGPTIQDFTFVAARKP